MASKEIRKMICINTGDHATKLTLKRFRGKTVSLAALWKCLASTINVSFKCTLTNTVGDNLHGDRIEDGSQQKKLNYDSINLLARILETSKCTVGL
jgi:hypothetical protein